MYITRNMSLCVHCHEINTSVEVLLSNADFQNACQNDFFLCVYQKPLTNKPARDNRSGLTSTFWRRDPGYIRRCLKALRLSSPIRSTRRTPR